MANTPISMNKIRQLIRMHSQGCSKQKIAIQTGIARNTLKKYLKILNDSAMHHSQLSTLSDKELEQLFIKPHEKPISEKLQTLLALFPQIEKELKRKGVTQLMQWEAYKSKHPEGLGRSQFNSYYAKWKAQSRPVMHIDHKAGDKMYIDFAGDRLKVVDKPTGAIQKVEVFVAILGASQLTYVEAVSTQKKEDLIAACENAMHYFEGVPAAIVPDNLKSAVTKSSKYEAQINESFADFAQHYNVSVLPARAYRPRDKALVENAVRIIYTRIYAKINSQIYYTLEELNAAIGIELEAHNNRLLSGRTYSRREQFEEIERSTLSPLPALRYELKTQTYATVAKNGHVALGADRHYYSVPYKYIGKKVKLMYSQTTVQIYYNYECIASHVRIKSPYNYTTDNDHMASTHQFVAEWSADRFLNWAASIHEDVKHYIQQILERKQHPEQAYKSCLGILSFAKKVDGQRLIKACQRASDYEIYNYAIIRNILERGMDKTIEEDDMQTQMPDHENLRGPLYFN